MAAARLFLFDSGVRIGITRSSMDLGVMTGRDVIGWLTVTTVPRCIG